MRREKKTKDNGDPLLSEARKFAMENKEMADELNRNFHSVITKEGTERKKATSKYVREQNE